jgi:hypothetical protein
MLEQEQSTQAHLIALHSELDASSQLDPSSPIAVRSIPSNSPPQNGSPPLFNSSSSQSSYTSTPPSLWADKENLAPNENRKRKLEEKGKKKRKKRKSVLQTISTPNVLNIGNEAPHAPQIERSRRMLSYESASNLHYCAHSYEKMAFQQKMLFTLKEKYVSIFILLTFIRCAIAMSPFKGRVVICDLETTGCSVDDEMIQISGIEVYDGDITGVQFLSLVQTSRPITPEAFQVIISFRIFLTFSFTK